MRFEGFLPIFLYILGGCGKVRGGVAQPGICSGATQNPGWLDSECKGLVIRLFFVSWLVSECLYCDMSGIAAVLGLCSV